ncbi:MAG: dihydroorotase [Deltaproteobacteria bacterium]|nr:dihydroorotase [Deltaproteobacteria bacterium]
MEPKKSPAWLVLRQVRAVDPSRGLDDTVDVLIEAGRVVRIGRNACAGLESLAGARVIDAAGKWLLPGFVEVHAHFREPGFEYKEDIESGLKASAAGGYAHVCAMPNTRPANDSPSVTRHMIERAHALGGPRLYPIAAVTQGLKGEVLTDMAALKAAGAVAFSDDGRCVTSSELMRRALQAACALDVAVIQHAEDHAATATAQMHEGDVSRRLGIPGWPRQAEDSIVARDLELVRATRGRYHVAHASTRGTVELVRRAKQQGLPVSAEAAPHHLLLTDASIDGTDARYKVNPPLREEDDVQALREGLADGTIECVATDHAPHSAEEKLLPMAKAPPGMVGIEFCLPLMIGLVEEGVLSLARLVDALTAAPARLIGIEAPALREGVTANLCLFDPAPRYALDERSLHSKSTNTPFAGRPLTGRVQMCLAQGAIAYEYDGK